MGNRTIKQYGETDVTVAIRDAHGAACDLLTAHAQLAVRPDCNARKLFERLP